MTPSNKGGWKLQLINDNLQRGSSKGQVVRKHPLGSNPSLPEKPATNSTSPDEMLRDTDINEPVVDSTSTDEARKSATYAEGQRNIPGEEEGTEPGTEGSGKENEAPTCCDPRVLFTETALRSHPDTTITIKQELVNECIGGGEEEGAVGQEKLT